MFVDLLTQKSRLNKSMYLSFLDRLSYEEYKKKSLDGTAFGLNGEDVKVPGEKNVASGAVTVAYMQSFLESHIKDSKAFLLHKKVVTEVFDFLISKSNADVQRIIFMGIAFLWVRMFKVSRDTVRLTAYDTDCIITQLMMALMTIPWASEFQRLEAESKQRKDAA